MSAILVLASASPFRKTLLENAGLEFEVDAARIDERTVEAALDGMDAEDVATILAEAKAQDVSARHPGAVVIGADQTMSFQGEILHKPADMDEARRRLLKLSGQTHTLNSAIVLARDGETIWRHMSVARMTMRAFDPGFVGRYLAGAGDQVLGSVGAYQIEGSGIQLFDRLDGDHFAIIGLPLLPLLAQLRELAVIDG